MSVETPTDAQATMPMNLSLRRRRPASQLITAPASGAKMISLRRLLSKKRISLFVFFHGAVSCNFVDHFAGLGPIHEITQKQTNHTNLTTVGD